MVVVVVHTAPKRQPMSHSPWELVTTVCLYSLSDPVGDVDAIGKNMGVLSQKEQSGGRGEHISDEVLKGVGVFPTEYVGVVQLVVPAVDVLVQPFGVQGPVGGIEPGIVDQHHEDNL